MTTDTAAVALSDSALVDQTRAGHPSAFETLTRRHMRRVYALTRTMTQNDEDAADAMQEAFLKAFTKLDHLESGERFPQWLLRIAANESLTVLRQRRQRGELSLDEPDGDEADARLREIAVWDGNPEQRFSRQELHHLLYETIASLPADYRNVFALRDINDFSTEATAEILRLTQPAVKTRLLRARLMLREKLTRRFRKPLENPFQAL
ncbi:MAG: sigma-70 family RNA polymerase sigma factor [Acidobacteria bacterium]|nr:sigma-70 family RNA polymerase sigma factor [Acidobacteriota bacterium]